MSKISPENLRTQWKNITDPVSVIVFYSHAPGKKYNFFSNFWKHKEDFEFTVPEWCGKFSNYKVTVNFSEKLIMLCKASFMEDEESFHKINLAKTPSECKKLGRKIKHWNEKLWQENVCQIAREIIRVKFNSSVELKEKLVQTGGSYIAEASPDDHFWGVGMHANDGLINIPNKWKGYNILGWALMTVRDELNSVNQ